MSTGAICVFSELRVNEGLALVVVLVVAKCVPNGAAMLAMLITNECF